jgi:integral membrane protein
MSALMTLFQDRLKQFRFVSWLEGISYLLLLFIAMPLKYLADSPGAVRVVGLVHGLLFVLFVLNAIQAKIELGWSAGLLLRALGTAFVPFGMLLLDKMLTSRKDEG